MKISKHIGTLFIVLIILVGAYQHGRLNAYSATTAPKIGVVNVTHVLENCQKHKQWQEKMQNEQAEVKKTFTKAREELEAIRANLKLRTPGSEDYLKLRQELTEKTALLEARDDFYRNKVEVQMQTWTESLYQEMLKIVEDVAKDKGLDMILADELMDLPSPSLRDFMLTIKTKKLLYHNSNYDLTEEVLAALDKSGQ
jgi:Skp family chaperone for outer membrane proteins